jgi:Fur family ferric uptake transcriptional regulator
MNKKKLTRYGSIILNLISENDVFLSAQEIYLKMRELSYPVGLATIYRQLQVLLDNHLIDAIKSESGEVIYKQCKKTSHHHHVICIKCGKSQEILEPEIELWTRRVAKKLGYLPMNHTIEIFGHCQQCQTP